MVHMLASVILLFLTDTIFPAISNGWIYGYSEYQGYLFRLMKCMNLMIIDCLLIFFLD